MTNNNKDRRLTPGMAAHVLANDLGELPQQWQVRLQNWRVPGRNASLQHHREEGGRPFYFESDLLAFIDRLKSSKSQTVGGAMHLADASAITSIDAIEVRWRSGGAEGSFNLNARQARQLAAQLTALASAAIEAADPHQEARG